MNLSQLTKLSERYIAENQQNNQELPGLFVLNRQAPSSIEAAVYHPVICLILQGSKITSIGDQFVELRPGDALLVSHDLPVVSRITKASAQKPYLAVIVSIDLGEIRSLYEQVADLPLPDIQVRSLSVGRVDPVWLAPIVRYFELMDNPLDAKVLGPAIRREIHYRLLLSPIGKMLRNLLVADSHASRISKAIAQVRAGFRSQLTIAELAKTAGMSASSFHTHFKSVTGTTPLQYLKELRLIEAKTLLAANDQSVSQTAFAVGYESPTHFSRDYARKFGLPPSRDTNISLSIRHD